MSQPASPSEQADILCAGAEEVISRDELVSKLDEARSQNRPLRIKQGFDPSSPGIHIGHAVGLRKLRQFQDLGHLVVLIVGDYTGMVGDPSEKSTTRPMLTHDEVLANARTYQEQFFGIVDPDRTEVRFNGEWFSQMSFRDVMELASKFTVARLLERDDFHKRYRDGTPISIHEFFYPLMQAYDSVAVTADVEIGGTDQKFNLLVGRRIQRDYGQVPQVVMTLPLLVGTDGAEKMSKSLGNTIDITDAPQDMYGKVMSIPDSLIPMYLRLATTLGTSEIDRELRKLEGPGFNPMDLKKRLAREVVTLFHGLQAAVSAEEEFVRVFSQQELPENVPEYHVSTAESVWIVRLLTETGLVQSASEARRLLRQGAVSVNGKKVVDEAHQLLVDAPLVLKVGKRRFLRVLPSTR
jgi:tyrosyl-tRNA synthetase